MAPGKTGAGFAATEKKSKREIHRRVRAADFLWQNATGKTNLRSYVWFRVSSVLASITASAETSQLKVDVEKMRWFFQPFHFASFRFSSAPFSRTLRANTNKNMNSTSHFHAHQLQLLRCVFRRCPPRYVLFPGMRITRFALVPRAMSIAWQRFTRSHPKCRVSVFQMTCRFFRPRASNSACRELTPTSIPRRAPRPATHQGRKI